MVIHTGYREAVDERKTSVPSVFSVTERFAFSDRNSECFWYSFPSVTSSNPDETLPNLCCSRFQVAGSVSNFVHVLNTTN